MKILITGKNGQMGYELAHIFAQPGNEIFALDRTAMDLSNTAQVRDVTRAIAPDATSVLRQRGESQGGKGTEEAIEVAVEMPKEKPKKKKKAAKTWDI